MLDTPKKIMLESKKFNIHRPIGSMYGIFTYIYHKNQPNVGKYTIHGSYGLSYWWSLNGVFFSTTSLKSHLRNIHQNLHRGKWPLIHTWNHHLVIFVSNIFCSQSGKGGDPPHWRYFRKSWNFWQQKTSFQTCSTDIRNIYSNNHIETLKLINTETLKLTKHHFTSKYIQILAEFSL